MDPGKEEGVGESSSPPRAATVHKIADAIHWRLLEIGVPEALADPHAFRAAIYAHFARLPPSYALDMNVDKAEDALLHRDILAEAKDPTNRPVFRARFRKKMGIVGLTLNLAESSKTWIWMSGRVLKTLKKGLSSRAPPMEILLCIRWCMK